MKRGYDESRRAHFVTGRFGVTRDLHVVVSGAPAVSMGTISVTIQGYPPNDRARQCEGLEVLINGEPFSTERNQHTLTGAGKIKTESRFDFSVFQPLAGRFPVFGVRACGTTWFFTPEQLEELRALLAVYSDLATQVQNNSEVAPATLPGQTTL